MNLTLKLSLPILFGLALAMGYLHIYWEPSQLAKGKAAFIQQNRAILESSESAIIRDVLEGNFAALIANVEYLLQKQEGVWFNLEIFSDEGKRLYPLFDTVKIQNEGGFDFIHEDFSLHLEDSIIGRLVVDINWSREKGIIMADVLAVRNLLLGMVLFSLLAFLLLQWRIVVRPLVRLRNATKEIAEGHLEVVLPHAAKDEVGELTRSFDFMARELSFKQYALDRHANVCITDPRGRITYINDNFCETSGYTMEELLGENPRILLSNVHPQDFYENMWAIISSGKTWKQEICNRKKNGAYYWLDMTIVPQVDKTNRPQRFIAISTDITVRKETEAELVESRLQAEAANRAKSLFLANMSHEFRTPLNSVIGLTQMMSQRQGLGADLMEEVERIHIAGQMLQAMVNDILDLSKIEAGEINLEMVPMLLEPVLDDLVNLLLPQARKKELELIFEPLPEDAKAYVFSDPTRLRQLLLNLLNNAIKFTSSGKVSLTVEPAGSVATANDGTRHLRLRFLVKDTGCGIPAQIQPTLFDAFKQADSSTTRQYGGTGLGLAIVKQLCGEMGGNVHVDSSVGKGSCFTLELPFRLATEQDVKKAGLHTRQFNILLAEDDPAHRSSLVAMCQQLGWDVESVENGRELLHSYQELLKGGQHVDCLIVDWQMPELDGLEVLSKIREKYGGDDIPGILMVSGYESEQLKQSPHAEIPDLILDKPLSIAALVNGLGLIFSKHESDFDLVLRSSKLDFAHLSWLPGVKILVVDDSKTNLDLATRLFEREGAEVSTCMDGAEALDWLQKPGNIADIVLMDVQMPVMDGNTAVRKIRNTESLQGLPVIALTAAALASERRLSLDAGMDDYQTKPFDTEKMVRLIRSYVGLSKGVPVPVKDKDVQRTTSHPWPDIAGIEPEGVRERLGDDLELFFDLLHRFTSENDDLLQPLTLKEDQEDNRLLMARLHKVAGSAGLVGAINFSALAKKVEHCMRNNELGEVPTLLERLREGYKQLDQAIRPVLYRNSRENTVREPAPVERGELDELIDALHKKKILATKQYQKLRAALKHALDPVVYTALDKAMTRLDFAGAENCLRQLDTAPPTDKSSERVMDEKQDFDKQRGKEL